MNPDDLRAIAEKAAKMTDGLVVAPRGPLSAFYAAFDPSTCLALLDELDGLKARVESAEGALRPFAAESGLRHSLANEAGLIVNQQSLEPPHLWNDFILPLVAAAHFTKFSGEQ